MKKIIAFQMLFFFISILSAQVVYQEGMTRELNSGRSPVSGVFIKFEDASSVNSDDNGNFLLAFQDKKAGDIIFLQDFKKSGYELVNRKDFEVLKVSNTNQLGIDMVLAREGVVDAAKKEYYDVSDRNLLARFEKEKITLKKQLNQAQLTNHEYQNQLQTLQKRYDSQVKELDILATKFARVNFDDVESIYQEALQLFKNGKVSEAITKLEGASPTQRTADIINEEKRIYGAQAELIAQNAQIAVEKKKQIDAVRLLADMYIIDFNIPKAEAQYDQLLLLDGGNLEVLHDAVEFYQKQHRYEKAKNTNLEIVNHPKAETWQIANAYSYLGNLHTYTGNFLDALEAYLLFSKKYQKLLIEHPSISFFKENLSISYSKLGVTHSSLGNLHNALTFYRQEHQLSKELYEAYPQNIRFKKGLTISYQNLGNTYTSLGDLQKSMNFYEQFHHLSRELHEANPQKLELKRLLAISYQHLGITSESLGNLQKALTSYERYHQLSKELYIAYPQNVEFKNGLATSYQNLGIVHSSLGDFLKSLGFFEKCHRLFKELHENFPQNVEFTNNLGISGQFLGDTHRSLGDMKKTLIFYKQSCRLKKELYETFPQILEYKNELAISYSKLGKTYHALDDLPKALTFYKGHHQLKKELYEAFPHNVEFKFRLAISYFILGSSYGKLSKEKSKALSYARMAEKLSVELKRDEPENTDFHNILNMTQKLVKKLKPLENSETKF